MKKLGWVCGLFLVSCAVSGPLTVRAAGTADQNLSANVDAATAGADGAVQYDATTDPATATTTAELTVTPGVLSLNAVPDLQFGEAQVKDVVAQDTTLNLASNTVAAGPVQGQTAFDGNNVGFVMVTDYRGNNAGWRLEANATSFATATSDELTGKLTLTGTAQTTQGADGLATMTGTVTTGALGAGTPGDNVVVWQAAAGTGQGQNTTQVVKDGGTTLTLDRNTAAVAGVYQAALTWTLTNAPS